MTEPNAEARLRREDLIRWFESFERTHDGRVIGTEQEKFGIALDHPSGLPMPVTYQHHVRPILEALVARYGWKNGKDRGVDGEMIALERDGASITLEPGGQLELSGAPLRTLHETCAEFTQHYRELHDVASDLGVGFMAVGFHPFARRDEFDWMPKGRYRVMREYLATRGNLAHDMMLRTCTVQANFDYTSEREAGERLRMISGVSSIVSALFANSPYREGEFTGFRSTRQEIWTDVDPDRTGLPSWMFDEGFSYERYIDYALDVPMFFVKREGHYYPHHVPFRRFMEDGFETPDGTLHFPQRADWELHLSTLFPEARLKPFIEVRAPDAVGSRLVCALPALLKGILYDDDAAAGAWELVGGLEHAERLELWREARVHALASDRVYGLASQLTRLAREGLDRLDVRDSQGRTEARFLDALDAMVERRVAPADEALAALGDKPGTGREARLAFLRHYHFAGAGGPEA